MSTTPPPEFPPQPPQSGPPAGNPLGPYPPNFLPPGNQPPAGGQPPPVVRRIPEDQPFVVRPNVTKRGLVFLGFALLLIVPITCCFGVGVTSSTTSGRGSVLAVVGMLGCLLAAVCLPLGLQLWLIGTGGPVLALGPAGLWIRTRPTRGQAIWLPWEGVAQISRRRWSLEKMLVVRPHDPNALANLGTYTALDSGMLSAFYGSGLVATLNFADKSEAEILAAVAHFSAGRCPLT
ncbi:hypothetical protein ACLQ2S_14415 [Micromonospora sp. DT48]|uniref:hypothetical protein n=1 Tax=unclassified Micromonospora TaxID=2617518 RepID=UPI0018AD234C|nr:hypothetical protein [Micromonospora sp. CP22]